MKINFYLKFPSAKNQLTHKRHKTSHTLVVFKININAAF